MTEPYEGPFDPVRCGGRTARPMGEFWATSDRMHTIRWAASAATTYGRKMAGAESFTGRWSDGAWGIDPYALKRIGDLAFCNGLNKMTLHGMALQPWADKVKPGMTMGFWGTMLCPGQTWWEPGKAWIAYLSRCQYLLQQGHMVADILWLLPSVNWADTIPGGLHKLYNYDLCSEEILLKAEIKDGRFVLPNSDAGYRVLLLPPNKGSMTPRLMKKLLELVNAGGTVVVGSGRPSFSPSLEDYPACDQEVRQLASELWGEYNGTSVKERRLGKGRLCVIPWGSERIDPEAEWVKQHRPAPNFTSGRHIPCTGRRRCESCCVTWGLNQTVRCSRPADQPVFLVAVKTRLVACARGKMPWPGLTAASVSLISTSSPARCQRR